LAKAESARSAGDALCALATIAAGGEPFHSLWSPGAHTTRLLSIRYAPPSGIPASALRLSRSLIAQSLATDITGTVDVSCDISSPYTISLSTGAGTYASRTMTGSSGTLVYNLYVDATRLSIWGDGSPGTGTVGGTANTASHTVYGRIPARQNAPVGSYTDTIIVTLTF